MAAIASPVDYVIEWTVVSYHIFTCTDHRDPDPQCQIYDKSTQHGQNLQFPTHFDPDLNPCICLGCWAAIETSLSLLV